MGPHICPIGIIFKITYGGHTEYLIKLYWDFQNRIAYGYKFFDRNNEISCKLSNNKITILELWHL